MTEAPSSNNKHTVRYRGILGAQADDSKPSFGQVPTALMRAKLGASVRSVAFYLWSHTDGWATSAEAIATAIGTTAKTVRKALDILEEAGWLVRQPTGVHNQWVIYLQRSNVPFPVGEAQELSAPVEITRASELPPVETTDAPPVETTDAPPVEITGPPSVKITELRVQERLQEDSSPSVSSPVVNGNDASTEQEARGRIRDAEPSEADLTSHPQYQSELAAARFRLGYSNPDRPDLEERAIEQAKVRVKFIIAKRAKEEQEWDDLPGFVDSEIQEIAREKNIHLPSDELLAAAQAPGVKFPGAWLRAALLKEPKRTRVAANGLWEGD